MLLALAVQGKPKKPPATLVISTDVNINKGEEKISTTLKFFSDQDPAHAAVQCAVEHALGASQVGELVTLLETKLKESEMEYAPSADLKLATAEAHMKRGDKLKEEGNFIRASHDYLRASALFRQTDSDGSGALQALDLVLGAARTSAQAMQANADGRHEEVIQLLNEVDKLSDGTGKRHKNDTLLLALAASGSALGEWSVTSAACGRLLRGVSKRGLWKPAQARSQAILLGSRAALNMGDLAKALSFWKVVIKEDPDTAWARPPYKQLKEIQKTLKDVPKWFEKSKNRLVEETMASLVGEVKEMKLNTTKLLSGFLIDQCKAKSAQKRYEEALVLCDEGLEYIQAKVKSVFTDKKKLVSALQIRSEAHMKDNNFDEAERDIRQAQSLTKEQNELGQLGQKLRNAEWAKDNWEKHTPDWALKVLELPPNFGELPPKKKCEWIKKNFKKFVRRWHPDKAKGDKRRAARKVDEVSQAKKILSGLHRCTPGGS